MYKVCGIYLLRFEGSAKVYVGQSVDVHDRYREHLNKLRKNTHQPKLTNAYVKYGIPTLEILCECDQCDLDTFEQEAIEIWDAVDNGYNFNKDSSYHGPSLPGELNKKAQYSKHEYIQMFNSLVDTNIPIKDLAVELNVNKNVLYQMANGSSHRKWLELEFPEKYKILLDKVSKRRNSFNNEKTIVLVYGDSEKEEILTTSIKEFADKHGLNNSHIGAVINGKLKQHKGWHLKH